MALMLVIPDAHAHPDFDNDRADWLGELIYEMRPETVLCLGDIADMPSLSSYDKGTRGFEGRRYYRDCEAAVEFQDRLWAPARRRKKALPHRYFAVGNHEARADKAANLQPELHGVLDYTRDLHLNRYWDEVHPFKEIFDLKGYAVSHFLPSGILGNPVGGKNAGNLLLTSGFESCIVGHSHTRDFTERTSYLGRKVQAIVAGCYVHPDMISQPQGWAANTAAMWWNGVVLLHNPEKGSCDHIEFISMDSIKREYSK